ncbi:hypothetical protein F6X40_17475 [Paraburkholderia sp. UCT31]|uniref:hypothetical protein n=1 Tax=Paraburkholderia sp. UCT31 TaxID=2615209 RepID=UPI00165617A5|nr:hypothetical protein [Paraburkholderia sp. UCT31]MBC8738552.1 hypothetical protein [Paraburkholderia sp. UCT31]
MERARYRPRFDRYHKGDWPYRGDEGVGLELSGAPTDAHALLDLLMGESCNPPAARRILHCLQAGESKRTTVMAALDFNALGDRLAQLGVTLRIIPPAEPANQDIDQAVLRLEQGLPFDLSGFSWAELAIIGARRQQLHESLQRIPHGFGPYEVRETRV